MSGLSVGKRVFERWPHLHPYDPSRRRPDKAPRPGDGQDEERGSSTSRPPSGSHALPALPSPRGPQPSPQRPGAAREQVADPERPATKTGSSPPLLSARDSSNLRSPRPVLTGSQSTPWALLFPPPSLRGRSKPRRGCAERRGSLREVAPAKLGLLLPISSFLDTSVSRHSLFILPLMF